VISAWALLRGRAWFENGAAIAPPKIGTLKAHLELRAEQLPEAAAWEKARYTASALFGYTIATPVLTGANVADFSEHIRARAKDLSVPVRSLADRLGAACTRLGIDQQEAERPLLTRLLAEQLAALSTAADNVALIDRLAGLDLPVAPETAARLLTEAPGDGAALGGLRWNLVDSALAEEDHVGQRPEDARKILGRLRAALSGIGAPLTEGLAKATDELIEWITVPSPPPPPPPPHPTPLVDIPTRTNPEEISLEIDTASAVEARLSAALRAHGKKVRIMWWVEE